MDEKKKSSNGKSKVEPVQPTVPWARQSTATQERVTARKRQVVHGLPDWEPLPPGEMIIRRGGNA